MNECGHGVLSEAGAGRSLWHGSVWGWVLEHDGNA
eukprot:COSAG06_NODE_65220_length_257_cov_1.202532_1_plen_34_part_10